MSLCDTARMTPARQPRQQRPLAPRSGRPSSPTATHRNRFPTSSGRVSTAIVVIAEAAAASPHNCERTSETPLLLAAYAEESGPGDGGGPASERGLWAHQTLCPEGHSDLDLSQLVFGMLYPAYYSYKAVKTKNVKEYVRWMMYWIVFALYTVIETIADQTVAWFPLYYELKIAFVIWLLSPYTKGASLIYRKFLHPLLSSKEREIDDYIVQAKERGYETMVNFGRQGLNLAATAAVTAAVKSQGAITERLRSFSMHDLTAIQGDEPVGQRPYQTLPETKKKSKAASSESAGYGIPLKDGDEKTDEEADGPYSDDEMVTHKGLRRSQSMKSVKTVKGRKEVSQV
ncbi:hypothetical protein HPG69_009254 [Diceros bicornis minor]|uniref:Receptor expression-enhancing protein n=1 Tax=Diceros bicornis minor TaxID=77932 RepID=A0A7J7FJ17_DICBM|nr:hypothetical protein HPG69_009254 [Diceros bicornis minor]